MVYLDERQHQRNGDTERELGQPNPVQRPVIPARTIDVVLREDLVKQR
jgi:hypothetical protein